jgi:hypothetical protein
MGFLETLATVIRDFLESLFASSSPEMAKARQLRQLSADLKKIDPPMYRADGFLLQPFAAALYQIYQKAAPVREILAATVLSPDRRVAEKYRDYLIELAFTPEQRKARAAATFAERSAALALQPAGAERLIDEQGRQFGLFLKQLDSRNVQQVNVLLDRVCALGDFCAFNFNGFFANFDPAFKAHEGQDTTVGTPSFRFAPIADIVPALLDLYYVLAGLEISEPVIDVVSILDAKRNNEPLGDETRGRVAKNLNFLVTLLRDKLGTPLLLSILRVAKEDPAFKPERQATKTDFVAAYKTRLTDYFGGESVKLLKDREESDIRGLLSATFGSVALETTEGYNDATNSLVQEFTPFSLQWVRPLEIIKTFTVRYFEPHFRQVLRAIVVEGYFANRTFQSSISASYYFCEAVTAKLSEFEALFGDNQTCSVKILTGYLTEMEKGMDFEKPLRQMIDNMNGHAKALIQQSVDAYASVFNFCALIIGDNKKTVPEAITNIRTLTTSLKNADSYASLEKELGVFRNFLEIMKKYAIVGSLSDTVTMAERTES